MKYIVDASVLYKEQIYIEADTPEEAAEAVRLGKGIRIGKAEKKNVHAVGEVKETELEI